MQPTLCGGGSVKFQLNGSQNYNIIDILMILENNYLNSHWQEPPIFLNKKVDHNDAAKVIPI